MIFCLCLGAFVAILSGLSGLGFNMTKRKKNGDKKSAETQNNKDKSTRRNETISETKG